MDVANKQKRIEQAIRFVTSSRGKSRMISVIRCADVHVCRCCLAELGVIPSGEGSPVFWSLGAEPLAIATRIYL